jgi:C_GCAxxG_C_C family probable redox protein
MGADQIRSMELALQGFGCSQVLALLALEKQGKTNPDLVRAMSGLHGGLGWTGKICGALSGGCCALALRLGRGAPEEAEDADLKPMIRCLVEWFEQEFGKRYGGIDCSAILAGDPRNGLSRCPEIVNAVHAKVQELLDRRS